MTKGISMGNPVLCPAILWILSPHTHPPLVAVAHWTLTLVHSSLIAAFNSSSDNSNICVTPAMAPVVSPQASWDFPGFLYAE